MRRDGSAFLPAGLPQHPGASVRIVVVHHERDTPANVEEYLIADFAEVWRRDGHSVVHVAGARHLPEGDIAILHVDLSVVPRRYAAALSRFPLVLNADMRDIRKRRVSQAIAPRGYDGAVIVKTNRNHGGRPDIDRLRPWRARLARAVMRLAGPDLPRGDYPVFATSAAVPLWLRWHPGVVVERYLPERAGDVYFARQSLFLGRREISWRLCGDQPVVRAARLIYEEEIATPAAIRDFRNAIGLDYGSVDYLVADGAVVVIDVGKTVGGRGTAPETVRRLAGGLAELWSERRGIQSEPARRAK